MCSNTNGFIGSTTKCNQATNESKLLIGYCMSYNNSTGETFLGPCPYSALHGLPVRETFVPLPCDPSEANEYICSQFNRTGLLCSHCMEGLGPAVFSYELKCVPCLDSRYGWLVYLLAAILPMTLFFFVVIIFQIQATSASMNSFIFSVQALTSIVNRNMYLFTSRRKANRTLSKALMTFYSIWNLDFFRYIIPPFCITPNQGNIHVLAMEYVVAFYPLLLVVVIYVCVELHDRGCRVLLFIARPLFKCFARFRRKWDPKASIIHTFATFILLSYSKLLFVSFNLLGKIRLHNVSGVEVGHRFLYYNASMQYFSKAHLPFAVLAIIVLCTFVAIPPIFLLLYPTGLLQKCCRPCQKYGFMWHTLQAFADAFQGCYKNGTNDTRDCRYFAGIYLILRFIFLFKIVLGSHWEWMISIVSPIVASILFALLRPYRNNWFNVLDSVHLALFGLAQFWVLYNRLVSKVSLHFVYALAVEPFVYITVYVVYKVMTRTGLLHSLQNTLNYTIKRINNFKRSDSALPDRLVNPQQYSATHTPYVPLVAMENDETDLEPQQNEN